MEEREPRGGADGAETELISSRPAEGPNVGETMGLDAPSRSDAVPASPSGDQRFVPGDLLAGRFRIVRFLARGAMGEVYEAEDGVLLDRVALKTLRRESLKESVALERFRREIHLARRVTHPNVCRIFDLFAHDDLLFLTMELVAGPTLAERIKKSGPMGTAEALPIVEQMASALDAAHAVDVIHRDFKSANVLLAPAGGGVRAVVTDFGLAREGTPDDASSANLTRLGDVVGTPAYMSPEQVEGRAVTAATDVYSLGVVLYELVSGVRPFVGVTPLSTAVKRLSEAPAPPRRHVPGLDARWETVILRCLARDPAARYRSAGEVVRALRGEGDDAPRLGKAARVEPETEPVLPPLRKRRGGWRRVAAGAGGVALAALLVKLLFFGSAGEPAPKARLAVAILGFKNLTARPEAAWLSTALSEMLATELGAGETVRTIPGENVSRMRSDLALTEEEALAGDTLSRIRKNLGADVVVLGSFTVLGRDAAGGASSVRLDVRLQDTRRGETVAQFAEAGSEAGLLDLVERVGARMRERLGVTAPPEATHAAAASFPADPEAARLFAEGLARLRRSEYVEARVLLEKAVAKDPARALPRYALASAWSALGYDAKAREEARRAFESAGSLARAERLLVEAFARETAREWDEAVAIYETLWRYFPDDVEHGLRLVAARNAQGKPKEALAALSALRALPEPARSDARIDLLEARACYLLGDYRRQQRAAERAVSGSVAQEARGLEARAKLLVGQAVRFQGEPDRAKALFREGKALYEALGDRRGVASALNQLGLVEAQQGDAAAAGASFAEALGMRRALGEERGIADTANNLANVLSDQGDLAAALPLYEEALALRREMGDRDGVAGAQNNVAVLLVQRGELSAARPRYDEALATWREMGSDSGIGEALQNLGDLELAAGNVAAARARVEEALAVRRKIAEATGEAQSLRGLGRVLLASGDTPGAKARFAESLAIRTRLGERVNAAECRVDLGGVDLREGRAAEAGAAAREAIAEFRSGRRPDKEVEARVLLSRALLAEGKRDEARREAGEAVALASRLPMPALRALAKGALAECSARGAPTAGPVSRRGTPAGTSGSR